MHTMPKLDSNGWKRNVARGVSDAALLPRPSAWLETALRHELAMLNAMRAARETVRWQR